MGRPRVAVLGIAGVVVVGAAAAGGRWALAGNTGSPASAASPSVATSTAPIQRTDVAERQLVGGTLSHAGSYNLIAPGGQGVLTRLPATGTVVRRGQTAYEVNGDPV